MTSVGLGGSGGTTTGLNPGGTASTVGTAQAETENIREGEVPAPIMELLKTVQTKIKENKDKSDEFQKQSNEGVKMVKFRLKEVNHMIADGVSAVAARDRQTAILSNKVTKDYRLGKEAEAVQESISRNSTHTVAQQHAIQHIVEMIREYEQQIIDYQEAVEQMTVRMRDIMQGQGQFTTAELKEYLQRFDAIFSSVANNLFEANSKVEDLRGQLNIDDQQRVKEQRPIQQSWSQFKGPAAFPSHAVLTQLGAMLKPAQAAVPGTTTGTGLFGSSTATGGSLFGSSTTAGKPLFGSSTTTTGGSLFPSLTSTSTAAPVASGSLFPSLATAAKPATQFGSTLSTNTSGLLFSSKK